MLKFNAYVCMCNYYVVFSLQVSYKEYSGLTKNESMMKVREGSGYKRMNSVRHNIRAEGKKIIHY